MPASFDIEKAKEYINPAFAEAWATSNFSYYSDTIYACKYGKYSNEERIAAGTLLLSITKEFIHQKWPLISRPFDAIVVPPENLAKEFNVTSFIAAHLQAGNIYDFSKFLSKNREVTSLKKVNIDLRSAEISGAFDFIIPEEVRLPKGILILDDVLESGSTALEVSRAIRSTYPSIPQYYLALTYIKGQAIK